MNTLTTIGRTWSLVLISMGMASTVFAHPLAPSLLKIEEYAPSKANVTWKTPQKKVPGSNLQPVLPKHCSPLSEPKMRSEGTAHIYTWRVDCGEKGLARSTVSASGIPASKTEVMVRVSLADKREFRALLTADKSEFQIPERQDAWQVFVDYIKLGFDHILSGADHLAFVFGLLLLVSRSTIFWTITAFTLGHSITLALSAMRIVEVGQRPVEILIAASIALVAWEIVRTQRNKPAGKPSRVPIWMAAGFGLLHGLGFAGALREVGLPQGEIPTALLAFNVGIELGQLAFVVVSLIPLALLSRSVKWSHRLRIVGAYIIGSLAFYWVFERIAGY